MRTYPQTGFDWVFSMDSSSVWHNLQENIKKSTTYIWNWVIHSTFFWAKQKQKISLNKGCQSRSFAHRNSAQCTLYPRTFVHRNFVQCKVYHRTFAHKELCPQQSSQSSMSIHSMISSYYIDVFILSIFNINLDNYWGHILYKVYKLISLAFNSELTDLHSIARWK